MDVQAAESPILQCYQLERSVAMRACSGARTPAAKPMVSGLQRATVYRIRISFENRP